MFTYEPYTDSIEDAAALTAYLARVLTRLEALKVWL